MPWLRLGPTLKIVDLDRELVLLSASVRGGIRLISEQFELFSTNNDVPCHTLRPNRGLELLHEELLGFLAAQGGVVAEPRWTGRGYRPHVSMRGGESFPPGSRHIARELALIERRDGVKTVVRLY
jgi:hypothetical protein